MHTPEPTPIFLVGRHRSGTTGLANHLCEHPDVVGVQHRAHGGIHESGYYPYVVNRYGSLDCWSNFRAFVEVMCECDYFRLTGVEKTFLLSLYPTSYAGFFKAVMDEFARRQGAQYWLEKTPDHTKYARHLARAYPSAQFVAILRDVEEVVSSSLAHCSVDRTDQQGAQWLWILIRLTIGWVYYAQSVADLRSQFPHRSVVVRYEDFRETTSEALKHICASLGLDYRDRLETVPYTRNTSFPNEAARSQSLRANERTLISYLARAMMKVPHAAFRSLGGLIRAVRPPPDLPEWFFKLSDRELPTDPTVPP